MMKDISALQSFPFQTPFVPLTLSSSFSSASPHPSHFQTLPLSFLNSSHTPPLLPTPNASPAPVNELLLTMMESPML